MKDFANKIKELRIKENISQLELAEEFKVSQNTIHKWETGKTEPNHDTLIKLAEYFNVSTDYLLGFEPTEQNMSVVNNALKFARDIGLTDEKIQNMTPRQKDKIKKLIEIAVDEK